MRNKKALAPLGIILIIAIILVVIYLILYLPFPAFKNFRTTINYFIMVVVWFILQVGLVFAYIKIGELAVKGLKVLKFKVLKWNYQLENYIITR